MTVSSQVGAKSQKRSSRVNLRLQRRQTFLTWVLVFLTIVLVGIGLVTVWVGVQQPAKSRSGDPGDRALRRAAHLRRRASVRDSRHRRGTDDGLQGEHLF